VADFVSDFWGWFIAVSTVLSLVFCAVILMGASKVKVSTDAHPGKASADGTPPTTGHVWDEDLGEYNNPLPRWWMGLFWITIFFAVVYLTLYPGIGVFSGVLGWSSTGAHAVEVKEAEAASAPIFARWVQAPVETVARDPEARAVGERLYLQYCSGCHGSDARGAKGFPNLTDADWLYGGEPAAIKKTIVEGRNGVMPPLGAAIGGAAGADELAHYVLSLSGSTHDRARAERGQAKFAVCAACHGQDGRGNRELGAPNLTDKIWLHGSSVESIAQIIIEGKNNAMPAHGVLLGDARVHVLTAYVTTLSQKKAP
jgi:cytochrome c oxidase cbb3-type subunit III